MYVANTDRNRTALAYVQGRQDGLGERKKNQSRAAWQQRVMHPELILPSRSHWG